MKLMPKNWVKFQHYRDRCPPWIKLHRDLLNDRHFISLPTASKALAPMLWLLASECKDGTFDASTEELAFRLRMDNKEIEVGLKALIDNGFFVDASTMLAPVYQSAIPERETERETETKGETEKKLPTPREKQIVTPDGVSNVVFQDFVKLRKGLKAPVTETAIKRLATEAKKAGLTLQEVMELCCQNGWRGFNAEWILKNKSKNSGERNQDVLSGLTRGLLGGGNNVRLLGK